MRVCWDTVIKLLMFVSNEFVKVAFNTAAYLDLCVLFSAYSLESYFSRLIGRVQGYELVKLSHRF